MYRNKYFLHLLRDTHLTQVKQLVKIATVDQILAASEIVLNLLEGNIVVSKSDLQKFVRFKNILRKIGSFSIKIEVKRKLLHNHADLLKELLTHIWAQVQELVAFQEETKGETIET